MTRHAQEKSFLERQLEDPRFEAELDDASKRHSLLDSLVERRVGAGLSQAELAGVMGTTQSAVSELECGVTDPRLSTLQRYCRAVGLELRVSATRSIDWREREAVRARLTALVESATLAFGTVTGATTGNATRHLRVVETGPEIAADSLADAFVA